MRIISDNRLLREALSAALTPDTRSVIVELASGEIERLAEIAPTTERLIVIGDDETLERVAARFEVDALVHRDTTLDELLAVVDQVRRGKPDCCRRTGFVLFARLSAIGRERRRADRAEAYSLSARQHEVLRLIADGLDNRSIADQLCLSIHTVKNHVHAILEKLDVCNRSQAALLAHERHWIGERRRA